jgi:hypothetical protein
MDTVSPRFSRIAVWDIVRVDFPFAAAATIRRRSGLVAAIPAVRGEFAVS